MRSIRTLILALYHVLQTIPTLRRVKQLNREDYDRKQYNDLIHGVPKEAGRKIFKATGSNIVIQGQEKVVDEPVLFVSNHQGNFDIFAHLGFIEKPFGFISKIEVKKIPIVRTWMSVMDCLFMDRKDRRQSVKTLKSAIGLLKNGHSILIYPEGTRSRSGELNEFKSGSLSLAKKANVTVQPVMIDGTYKIMEANKNRIKKSTVYLTFCDPIHPEEFADMNVEELSEETKKRIEKALVDVR